MPDVAVLHVIGGNDRGKLFELTRAETRIGRGTDQDLVLADIAISRRHVTILREGPRYRVRDLGSGNGTLVNGQRVDTQILNDGDQIEVGNTLMRFDHAASRPAGVESRVTPPPIPGGMTNRQNAPPPIVPRLGPSGGTQMPSGPPPDATPSDAVSNPQIIPPPVRIEQPGGVDWVRGLIDTTSKQLMVFVPMAIVLCVGMSVLMNRMFFVKPEIVESTAERAYRAGLKLFAIGDYQAAKEKFKEAATFAPESAEARQYLRQCDTELHARTAIEAASKALTNRKYLEAVRALATVESNSISYDTALSMQRKNAPQAAAEEIEEARRLIQDDPENARARLNDALRLDPDNREARELLGRIRGGTASAAAAPAPATTVVVAPRAPREEKVKPPREERVKPPREEKVKVVVREDKGPKPPPGPAVGGLSDVKAALSAYKNRDFSGAEEALKQEAKAQGANQKAAQRLNEIAADVQKVRMSLERAQASESARPDQAVKDYESAISLDGKLSRGVLASFLRSKMGKVQITRAQQALQQGRLDEAFRSAQVAQQLGAGDGGVLKQLEAKAAELVNKGFSVQKTNLAQAKSYWRMVLKIVPEGSPNHLKASNLLGGSGQGQRRPDEDED